MFSYILFFEFARSNSAVTVFFAYSWQRSVFAAPLFSLHQSVRIFSIKEQLLNVGQILGGPALCSGWLQCLRSTRRSYTLASYGTLGQPDGKCFSLEPLRRV